MKILLAHNFYASSTPSGESVVFDAERRLLTQNGHTVEQFVRYSDDIIKNRALGKIQGALATPWNPFVARHIIQRLEASQPKVVHVHNTFPLISPSIFHAIGKRAARVLTLHNYRLFCPAAVPMRDNQPCTLCLDRRSSLPSLKHKCYRGSRIATAPLALNVALHRTLGTWSRQVDAFITLSDFQRELMISAGLPAHKVHVKPNFYPGNPCERRWEERGSYVTFVGRLSQEKGVLSLLKAWQLWGASAPELRIVGDGPLRETLQNMALGLPIRFLGQLSPQDAQKQIADAKLLVLPSEWFEGFPMVVREAFAFGTPSAVTNIGPLPSIVDHMESGIIFQPASPQSLLHEVRAAWEDPYLLERLGKSARTQFENKYTEGANYEMLMEIYDLAINESQHD